MGVIKNGLRSKRSCSQNGGYTDFQLASASDQCISITSTTLESPRPHNNRLQSRHDAPRFGSRNSSTDGFACGPFLEFVVLVEREDGTGNSSEVFEVELPRREIVQLAQESGALTGCLIGGMVYMIPGVVHYYEAGESYFGIDKELPVISYFRGGYNYPVGYLALEYIHLPKAVTKNFVSITANGILEFKPVEYLSAGIGYTTDFRKSNSLTLDVSVGLFRVLNVFTFYVENRFGYYPSAKSGYSQQSIGLFSSFFSIQL